MIQLYILLIYQHKKNFKLSKFSSTFSKYNLSISWFFKNFDIGLYRKSTKRLNPISFDNFNKLIVPLKKSPNPDINDQSKSQFSCLICFHLILNKIIFLRIHII
jgi:hypothetical protein